MIMVLTSQVILILIILIMNTEFELTESFLDSDAFPRYDGINQNSMLNSHNYNSDKPNKGGVLGLVKEYYKKSDVGR